MANTQAQAQAENAGLPPSNVNPETSALCMRPPRKGEIRVLDLTTTPDVIHIPDGNVAGRGTPDWRGRFVNMKPVGGKLYYVIIMDGTVPAISETVKSALSALMVIGSLNAKRVTAQTSPADGEVYEIADGAEVPVWIPYDALGFVYKGSAAALLRTHPSER